MARLADLIAHWHWGWQGHWSWSWIHDLSLSALAAAVAALGIVLLLELRSVVRLRRVMDRSLARVFEQLDLLRFESQRLIDAQDRAGSTSGPGSAAVARPAPTEYAFREQAPAGATPGVMPGTAPATSGAYESAATLAARGLSAREIAARCGLPAGEARLLASLAQARSRRAG